MTNHILHRNRARRNRHLTRPFFTLKKVIPSDLRLLDDAVEEITAAIGRTGCWNDVECIGLATREALSNAILHGNHCEAEEMVLVSVAVAENCDLLISIKDSGRGFDPARLPNATAPGNLLASHGRGIFLMKQFMDGVSFKFDQGTEVQLSRMHK